MITTTTVSAIIPTIGRLSSLKELLSSISAQTYSLAEVIIADASNSFEIKEFVALFAENCPQIRVIYLPVNIANAVYQRQKAIAISNGELLFFLDDDIVLAPDCLEKMVETIKSSLSVVGVCAMLQQHQSDPPRLWSFYLRYILKLQAGEWQGRVVGPLLRFGYNPPPIINQKMEWLGTGNSLVRRATFDAVGGFSTFFLHRCTINEDVDLGLKLNRIGTIVLCPHAKMVHKHAPSGRVTPILAAEDDLYNRFLILKNTVQHSTAKSLNLILIFWFVETISDLFYSLINFNAKYLYQRMYGRLKAMMSIVRSLREITA